MASPVPGLRPSLVFKASQTCGRLCQASGSSPQSPPEVKPFKVGGPRSNWGRFLFRSRRAAGSGAFAAPDPHDDRRRLLRRLRFGKEVRHGLAEGEAKMRRSPPESSHSPYEYDHQQQDGRHNSNAPQQSVLHGLAARTTVTRHEGQPEFRNAHSV